MARNLWHETEEANGTIEYFEKVVENAREYVASGDIFQVALPNVTNSVLEAT